MRATRWYSALLLAFVLLSLGLADAAAAPSQQVRYDRFDVDIAIAPNGDFRVTETQQVAFLSGTFQRASRNIGLGNLVDVRDVTVGEGGRNYTLATSPGQPGTYTTSRSGSQLKVEWYFPPTSGARRTFVLAYTIVGGLRIYPTTDVLDWQALRPDLPASANAAMVTVHLPADVAANQLQTASRGAAAQVTTPDARTVRFTAGAVPKGTGLEVKVGFPHGLVSAAPPPWQSRFDQTAAVQQRSAAYRNLFNLLLGAFGLLVLVGGGLVVYLLWYLRGRDYHVGLVAEYLREPPDSVGPGVAGTLLDEQADLQDVMATFVDLGRRGVLRISENTTPGVFGTSFGAGRDFTVEKLESNEPLTAFERTLLETLFPQGVTQVRLSEVKGRFTAALPRFQEQLYAEVVQRGYFPVSPEATRRRYRAFGTALLVLAVASWIGFSILLAGTASWQIVPALALFIVGLALRSVARVMPAKTELGATEAAKWQAFRRYLANLEKYDKVEDAKAIFERYLPYATAFGLDKSWIQKFAAVNAPAPTWYGGGGGGGPVVIMGPGGGYYGGPRWGGGYVPGGNVDGGPGPVGGPGFPQGGPGWQIPSLQDVSDRGGGGLQSLSDSLMGMLDSASSVFGGGGGGGDSGGFGGWSGGGGGGGNGGSSDGGGSFG